MKEQKVFDEYLKVFEIEDVNKNGVQIKRQVMSRKDANEDYSVAGTLHDADRDIYYLVRQYRAGASDEDRYLTEVMAGTMEIGEDPEECFKREAMEEVGFRCDTVEEIGSYYTSPGGTREKIFLFHATGERIADGGGLAEENEDIEILELNMEDIDNLFIRQEIKDLKTMFLLSQV